MKKSILCKLGIHKWSKTKFHSIESSNIRDYQKYCLRRHKIKKWSEPK